MFSGIYYMRFTIILLLLILTATLRSPAQTDAIKKISGLPTKEIYNLMIDSKGFLWIAHDLGVSRYDGVNFVSYASPEQTSLSATDLLEDKQGRIWFHNFTGQIFYIENDQVHLLKAYDFKAETAFPRIVLLGNELAASTEKGLFICNTINLSCRYLKCAQPANRGTSSLAVTKNAVIGYGDGNWFLYRTGQPLKMVTLRGSSTDYVRSNSSTISSSGSGDTAFLFSNPASVLATVTLHGDSLTLSAKKIITGDFINTVTTDARNVWVNTIHKSFLLSNTKQALNGYDITAIVTDKEGNTWYSSLKNGLMVKYRTLQGSLNAINIFKDNDRVNCIEGPAPALVLGTQNGNILVYDTKKGNVIKKIRLPGNHVSVNYLYRLEGSRYIVGTSVDTYEVDIEKGTNRLYPFIKSLKEVDKTDQFIFVASAKGLVAIPLKPNTGRYADGRLKEFTYQHDSGGNYFNYRMRCRAVCYDPANKSIFVAFKDGLYVIDDKGIRPFLFNGTSVYSMCLKYVNGEVIIGTINNGLIMTDGHNLKHLTVSDGLASNTVVKIKNDGSRIWLLSSGATSVLDARSFKIIPGIDLSSLDETQVLDVAAIGNNAYAATSDGFNVFSITKSAERFDLKNYLQTVSINNHPVLFNPPHRFPYFQNNIQFNLTAPFYYHARDIYFKYLLAGTNNPSWRSTEPGGRSISFSELSPGKYKFKAYAVHPQFGITAAPVTYEFSIAERWWQTWLFKILFTLLITALISFVVASYLLNRLRLQKSLYDQQLALQNERQRISSEMHDDVGAGLSAIKLFLNMAKNDKQRSNIDHISDLINEMSEKINEIIWSTNTENDTLESLVNHIEHQSYKLFKHTDVNFKVTVPLNMPDYMIPGEKRRNIYLVTKELLHNSIKHSKSLVTGIELKIEQDKLLIIIYDKGIGFDHINHRSRGMGLKNARARILGLKGKMKMESGDEGTTIWLEIPLK